jgi:hypothetical protein
MTVIYTVYTLLWEQPQTALGAGLRAALRALGRVRGEAREGDRVFVDAPGVAVSLGRYVFWFQGPTRWTFGDAWTRSHEAGHAVQSALLGPLYLPLVGVPSALRALYAVGYRELTGRRWRGYFQGYPEAWADRLGHVDRARAMASWPED